LSAIKIDEIKMEMTRARISSSEIIRMEAIASFVTSTINAAIHLQTVLDALQRLPDGKHKDTLEYARVLEKLIQDTFAELFGYRMT
jgi:hypothetical protein